MTEQLRGWKELPMGALPFKASTEFKTGDWRVQRPVIEHSKCKLCMICWIFCPEMAISLVNDEKVEVDYDYCKGCGICARECPLDAIAMVPEGVR